MKNRLTVVQYIYHTSEDSREPLTISMSYGRNLTSTEEAYTRIIRLGTAEIPLDLGWVPVENSSAILIGNASDKNTIEVLANKVPFAVIEPGESVRFQPHPEVKLTVRCPGGGAKLNVISVPK